MATISVNSGRFSSAELARSNSKPVTEGTTSLDGLQKTIPTTSLGENPTEDVMWSFATIDETKWDQSFPYQLVFLKKGSGGANEKTGKHGYLMDLAATFTLPIPPQELSISTPFAITTSVTLGGIVEEHNGAPIRMINASGTTGHLPLRGSPYKPKSKPSQNLNGVFGGTIQGISQTAAGVTQALNPGVFPLADNVVTDAEIGGNLARSTGYYQFHLLEYFLESYVNLRKTPDGKNYRLGLVLWKDSEVYLVTPVSFDLKRSSDSPMEYRYSMSFKAWRRIGTDELNQGFVLSPNTTPVVQDPNALAGLLNRITGARHALQGLKNVITGFRGDVDNTLFRPLRELVFSVKDMVGVGLTALDLPVNILKDLKGTIVLAASLRNDVSAFGQAVLSEPSKLSGEVQDLHNQLKGAADTSGIGSTQSTPYALSGTRQPPNTGSLGATADTDPVNKIFNDPDANADLFNSFNLGSLRIPPTINKKIVQERQRIRNFSRVDFLNMRNSILKLQQDYADFVGVGDTTFSANYGRLPPPVTTRTPTDDDWEVMFHINQIVLDVAKLAASRAVDTQKTLTSMDYVAALANQAGVTFRNSISKIAVPYPVGSTLEMVASRYLQDATRWVELATLNGLRAPYVDEAGFDLVLLVNGRSNEVQVSSAQNLFIGQPVWLQSATQPRELHHILSIRKLSDKVVVVGLDGIPNLERFVLTETALLFAFLPGTINSTQIIYIPSQVPAAQPDFQAPGNPNINPFDSLLQVGGVDILLTQDNDIFMTPDGDSRYAVGLQNITQVVRLALSTPKGSLLLHPEYGLTLQPGTNVADLTADQVLAQLRTTFRFDPMFTNFTSASVILAPPAAQITATIGIAGWPTEIPITFNVASNLTPS